MERVLVSNKTDWLPRHRSVMRSASQHPSAEMLQALRTMDEYLERQIEETIAEIRRRRPPSPQKPPVMTEYGKTMDKLMEVKERKLAINILRFREMMAENPPHSLFPLMSEIMSGGQTGVDRAALDWAIKRGIPHRGYCPKGRKAEDGIIDPKYKLQETETEGYHKRTRLNLQHSHGTLILSKGELDGGTLLTFNLCKKHDKPVLLIDLDEPIENSAEIVREWITNNKINTLNVAGPREGKRPGIYKLSISYIEQLLSS